MNTTRLAVLVVLFTAACDAAPTDTAASADSSSMVGNWTIHLIPQDRVVTSVPPPCDGTMAIDSDDGSVFSGSWSCGGSTGNLEGNRVPEEGGSWIEFWVPPPSISPSLTRSDWVYAWALGLSSPLKGPFLTAMR